MKWEDLDAVNQKMISNYFLLCNKLGIRKQNILTTQDLIGELYIKWDEVCRSTSHLSDREFLLYYKTSLYRFTFNLARNEKKHECIDWENLKRSFYRDIQPIYFEELVPEDLTKEQREVFLSRLKDIEKKDFLDVSNITDKEYYDALHVIKNKMKI